MTQEEKQLLLKDLCARLPYEVIIHVEGIIGGNYLNGDSKLVGIHNGIIHVENQPTYGNYEGFPLSINIKPYLRPMSSVSKMWGGLTKEEIENPWILFDSPVDALDYFLINHIDFHGLIPMGLALEAPEDMYKTK